jgi:hypothetical protein
VGVSWWWRAGGGAHPGGAHEATGNEAHAVDLAEHHFHQLRHQFLLHHPLLVVAVVVELLDYNVVVSVVFFFFVNGVCKSLSIKFFTNQMTIHFSATSL